ncbi:hypothetical protein C0995_009962 [Termitomyces sp. Mi166|nr:hypothetical protein C0995_009962 [Termitomyces sp. Mi166\
MHAISIPAPPPQFAVVILTTDPRTLEQYDGLVATQQKTAAMSKGKGKVVAIIKSESDYGQFSSEDKQELEESESAAQHFQHKLATKKANVAKAEAAQQHWAINDFSGHIPDRLGVKVWGPLNVEQLNSCFQGALDDCMYYSPYSNTVHVGADANQAAAFEFNSHQWAKVPATIVYKYAPHGLLHTPYELERLYKYYANKHVPQCDHVVAYMLISELLQFVQRLDDNLHNCTMQIILSDPLYWDLKNPIQGSEDMDLVKQRHIPTRFLRIKEDGTLALRVMCAPDPSCPFDLEQVHVPDDQACNFSDDDTLRVLLHNCIPLDWVDHAYTYGMVYLEQQFHSLTMSLDIFREVNDERIERLSRYSTPPAILQWDGWQEMTEG